FYGEGYYLLVPKRALGDRAQESALRELMRSKYGAKMEVEWLPESPAPRAVGREYVPPAEPPDWR
ncbi:MAG TPA: hypothetical protein VF521_12765, partial [Pyrinomonadaceae bacterium]